MNKENKKGIGIKVFNFNAVAEVPVNKWNKGLGIINWGGNKNNYPDYLWNLYNNVGSSTHTAIINKKVAFIAGKGFVETEDEKLNNFIKENKLKASVKRAALDYEVLNAFAFEVVYANDGSIFSVQHMPVSKLRIGVDDEGDFDGFVWFSNDWANYRKPENEPEAIDRYNPTKNRGKQIYLYFEYNPKADFYSIPSYNNAINWIRTDYEISKFHLNEVTRGFTPSFMLNFATGIPLEEEQEQFFKEFKKQFSGTEGEKLILTYSEGKEQAPELSTIDLNNSDERFTIIQEMLDKNIVVAHNVPSPIIIQTPGKLAGTDERVELMEEFQNSYVSARQETIEDALNEILGGQFQEELRLNTYLETEEVSESELEALIAFRNSSNGITSLLTIKQSLKDMQIGYDEALGMLELMFGYSSEDAARLLGPNMGDNNIINNEE